MLAGAIQQYLKAQGLTKVNVALFADYAQDTSYAVATFRDTDAEFTGGVYFARVQLRARSTNVVAAENAARTALTHLLNADGDTLLWDDPAGPAGDRSYLLEAISRRNGPDFFPTPTPGYQATCNLQMFVTEV